MPLPDSVTACRGQNRMLLQSHRCSAILAQALGHLFLRQKVALMSVVKRKSDDRSTHSTCFDLRQNRSLYLFDESPCTEQEMERLRRRLIKLVWDLEVKALAPQLTLLLFWDPALTARTSLRPQSYLLLSPFLL